MVDGYAVELIAGMTVRHALLARYSSAADDTVVFDQWGNRIGLDGALEEGTRLKTEKSAHDAC